MSEGTTTGWFADLPDRRELEKKAKAEGRLPPGQSLTLKWPVLQYGSVPSFDAPKWDFRISGQVEEPQRLTWEEFRALPRREVASDFHCVTRWSRLNNRWKGVLFTEVLKRVRAKPAAQFALVLAAEGYTANVPLEDLQRPNVLFAFEHERAAFARAWRSAPAGGAALKCVEKREVGARVHAAGSRSAGILGAERLSRLRRSVERAKVFGTVEHGNADSPLPRLPEVGRPGRDFRFSKSRVLAQNFPFFCLTRKTKAKMIRKPPPAFFDGGREESGGPTVPSGLCYAQRLRWLASSDAAARGVG